MNFHDIEAFLAIVKYGTISKAADELHMSQTAVTRRLQMLEADLGVPLLDRGRGIKETALTPSGQDFLAIAGRWRAVWEETQRFKSAGERLSLSAGSVQILNDFVFPPLYAMLLTHAPSMNLFIHTEHAHEFPPLVEQRVIDVAVGWRRTDSPELTCRPWKESPLVAVFAGNPAGAGKNPVDPASLDVSRELFINWPQPFDDWHDRWWPKDRVRPSFVASANLALAIMARNPALWAVMPLFFARRAAEGGAVTYQPFTDGPQPLTAFIITHKNPRPNIRKSLSLFFSCLDALDEELTL